MKTREIIKIILPLFLTILLVEVVICVRFATSEIAPKLPQTIDFTSYLIALSCSYFLLFRARIQIQSNSLFRKSCAIILTVTAFLPLIFSEDVKLGKGINRVGLDAVIYSEFSRAIDAIKDLQSKISSDKTVIDEVPKNLQIDKGSFQTLVYKSADGFGFEKISEKIFGGTMSEIQLMSANQKGLVCKLILIFVIIAVVADFIFKSDWSVACALVAISTLSIFLSLNFSSGMDECFLNLRHSQNLLEHGVYSINSNQMLEASVDFLPLLLTAFLGFLGLDLLDAAIVFSLLGNVVLITVAYFLVKKLTTNRHFALLSALLVGTYQNVVTVGATGFFAVLFTGCIFAASYFLLFTRKKSLGLILLSLLTLIRTEGILFAAILMFYLYVLQPLPEILRNKKWQTPVKNALIDGSIVAAPFILSCLIRFWFFGSFLPNPILFKNSDFDIAFFAAGFDQFFQIVSSYDLHLLILLNVSLLFVNFFLLRKNHRNDLAKNI